MSKSSVFNIMAGHYCDQVIGDLGNFELGGFDPLILQGSMSNPLSAYRLLCIDVDAEMSFDSDDLAKATGVPADWFESDRLIGDPEKVLRALGVMSLVFLACLRNEVFKYGLRVDVTENALEAESTLEEVLRVNERLKSH